MIALERRGGRPLRIGHKGAALLAPENTLASFRAAVEAGVDLVELDVLALDGGELVVAHSDDLREVSHGAASGTLRHLSLAELRGICPQLPTLDDALELFAGEAREVGVHVDLKERRVAEAVAAALQGFGLLERAFVSSVDWTALRRIAQAEPRLRTGVTFPRDRFRLHGRQRAASLVRGALATARVAAPLVAGNLLAVSRSTALVVHHAVVTPALVRRAHAHRAAVVAWTVDEMSDLVRVDAAGVDAIVSNDPTIFRSTLPP